jgi:hypothetical protein
MTATWLTTWLSRLWQLFPPFPPHLHRLASMSLAPTAAHPDHGNFQLLLALIHTALLYPATPQTNLTFLPPRVLLSGGSRM